VTSLRHRATATRCLRIAYQAIWKRCFLDGEEGESCLGLWLGGGWAYRSPPFSVATYSA